MTAHRTALFIWCLALAMAFALPSYFRPDGWRDRFLDDRPDSDAQGRKLIEVLLDNPVKSDRSRESQFFQTLAELARQQGLNPEYHSVYDSGASARSGRSMAVLSCGRAVRIRSGEQD